MVTPDTLRFPVDLPAPSIQPQHNPMYLPVSSHMTMSDQFRSLPHSPMTTVAMTQTLPPVRSISCQVSLANQKIASSPELKFAENEKPRFNRSHSARRYREKSQKDSESSKKNVSVRAQDDCLISKDVNIMKSNINKVKEKGMYIRLRYVAVFAPFFVHLLARKLILTKSRKKVCISGLDM